jgi:hypothetical protein
LWSNSPEECAISLFHSNRGTTEDLCYRLYAYQEKVFQLVNAALQLGHGQAEMQLRGKVLGSLRKQGHSSVTARLAQLETNPMMQTLLEHRKALTHRLMEHELGALSGMRRILDEQYEDDDVETHMERDRWDLLAESMDINAYRERLVQEFDDVWDALDKFERSLCKELIMLLSRDGPART